MESAEAKSVQLLCQRIDDEMIPLVRKHVVSIAAYYEGEPRQHATGTLVRFSDCHFLVTAAHAIKDYHKGRDHYPDLELYVDNGDSNDYVRLYGEYLTTQTVRERESSRLVVGDERDDLWDIGLWELHRETVDALTNKRFLNRSDIAVTEDLTTGIYYLAGCPCMWAQVDTESQATTIKWLRYTTVPYPKCGDLPNFDERFHMALCLDGMASCSDKVSQMPAQLTGISGCPIWKVADVPVPHDWNVDQARVVAVQTGVYAKRSRKAIRGTKWKCVLPVLAVFHPEIREGFKVWLPGKE